MSTAKTRKATAETSVDAVVTKSEEPIVVHHDAAEVSAKDGSLVFEGYEEVVQFGRDNVEALVLSSGIVARGVQDLSNSVVSVAQDSLEESVAVGKAIFGAKSIKEVLDLSSSLAKSNFDKVVAEASRLSHLSTKLAEEALLPLQGRVEAAVEKLTKHAA